MLGEVGGDRELWAVRSFGEVCLRSELEGSGMFGSRVRVDVRVLAASKT
jgi:hypothetical protein